MTFVNDPRQPVQHEPWQQDLEQTDRVTEPAAQPSGELAGDDRAALPRRSVTGLAPVLADLAHRRGADLARKVLADDRPFGPVQWDLNSPSLTERRMAVAFWDAFHQAMPEPRPLPDD